MRNLLLLTVIAAVIGLAFPAYAVFEGPSSSTCKSNAAVATTVKAILDKSVDDMNVTLKGHISKQVSKKHYLFTDGTAEIKVEIDGEHFPAIPVTPQTLVEISGEVEKKFFRPVCIEARSVNIVQPVPSGSSK
jgi:uncharacterized protein (TIGR00156 family)